MTDIDHTIHPSHKGAAGNREAVSEALAWRRKRDVDLLRAHGGNVDDVLEWAEQVADLTNALLRKIEGQRSRNG